MRLCAFAFFTVPRLCVLALLLLSGSLDAQEPVASVGGSAITVERLCVVHARSGRDVTSEKAVRDSLQELIDLQLLASAASKAGLDRDPEVIEQMHRLLVERYVREKVDQPLRDYQPTNDELAAAYKQHADEFRLPAMARGQVLTLLVREGRKEAAVQRAQEVLRKIEAGMSFEEAIRQFSEDARERTNRGQTEWVTAGKINRRYAPELVQALLLGPTNAASPGMVAADRAVYLVRVVERRAEVMRPMEDARQELLQRVRQDKRDAAYRALCAEAARGVMVSVDEQLLKSAVERPVIGSRPPQGPITTDTRRRRGWRNAKTQRRKDTWREAIGSAKTRRRNVLRGAMWEVEDAKAQCGEEGNGERKGAKAQCGEGGDGEREGAKAQCGEEGNGERKGARAQCGEGVMGKSKARRRNVVGRGR